MHVSNINQMQDKAEILSFIQRFSFGTIITSIDNKPTATHLPFSIFEKEDKWLLSSHFNKANPQWRHLEENTNLVIFTEPHAYISPINYVNHPSVPTWNYIAVHAYGKGSVITAPAAVVASIERLIKTYEPPFLATWNSFADTYREKMLKGIVAFEIEVNEIVASKKLSQHKSREEQSNIIASLGSSEQASAHLVAEYMLHNLK